MASAKLPTKSVLRAALEIIVSIDQQRAIETDRVLTSHVGPSKFLSFRERYDTYTEALAAFQATRRLQNIENIFGDQRSNSVKIANLCRESLRLGHDSEYIALTHDDLSTIGITGKGSLEMTFEYLQNNFAETEE